MSKRLESGAFLIIAIMLVVVVAIMAVTLGYLSTSSSGANTLHTASGRAFFAALSGLDVATGLLAGPGESRRLDCTDGTAGSLTGNGLVTKASMDASGESGAFTVTTRSGVFDYHPATPARLSSALSAVSTTTAVPVSTITGYATEGLIMIDRERIDYAGVSTATTTCMGASACFIGVTRGAGDTDVAAHASNTPVGQLQCRITATGGYPNLTSTPTAQRVVTQATQMEETWAVGAAGGGSTTRPWFVRYRDNGWSDFSYSGSPRNAQLNEISMLSYAEGYAVGAASPAPNTNYTILRWTGSSWFALPAASLPAAVGATLNSVYCVTAGDCHAVGNNSTNELFLRLASVGGNWTRLAASAALPNVNFNSVYCVSSTLCWAVGVVSTGELIAYWTGGPAWARQPATATVPNVALTEVRCWDANLCWIVGAANGGNATFIKWVGGTPGTTGWQYNAAEQPSPAVNVQLNSVVCASATDCWAVGNAVGSNAAIFRWQGSGRWTRVTLSPAVNAALNTVRCSSTISCWAVGNVVGGSEFIIRWDGRTWTRVGGAGGTVGDRSLLSVSITAAASDRAAALRREFFP